MCIRDRDNKVLSFIPVLVGCLSEAAGHLLDAVVQNIGQTHQYRSRYIAQLQLVHQLF